MGGHGLRRIRRRAATIAALALLLIATPATRTEEAQTPEDRLAKVVAELTDLDAWLSDAEARRAALLREVREGDRLVAEAVGRMQSAEASLASIRKDTRRLAERAEQLMVRRTMVISQIRRQLDAANRLTGQTIVKILLNQSSPAAAERMLVYHRFVLAAREATLVQAQQLLRDIEENRVALSERQTAEQMQFGALSAERDQLEAERLRRLATIDKLALEAADREARREQLALDRERFQKLIAEVRRFGVEDGSGAGFAARRGQMAWPLQGEIVGNFGEARDVSGIPWEGILVEAPRGQPVTAVHGGEVVLARWFLGFGNLMIVSHGDGYYTVYGHADHLQKSVNDPVEAGEVIASAGQSGGASASGIYFELRADGKAQDPLDWLSKGS